MGSASSNATTIDQARAMWIPHMSAARETQSCGQLERRAPRIRADKRLDYAAPVCSRGGSDLLGQRPSFVTFSAAGPFWP